MQYCRVLAVLLLCGTWAGCGTTKWTDTRRTATEQLLISDAMDRAVSRLDFRALAGKKVCLDDAPLKGVTDAAYLSSSLRQHLLASGCILKDKAPEADYLVEARAGAVGTDHHEVLFGVPAVNIPAVIPISGMPSSIPEIPLAKKTEQRAVAKIALFAYDRETGRPVWQSGVVPVESKAKDLWILGAGPFQRGTIYDGINFAGDRLKIPLVDLGKKHTDEADSVSVAQEAYFVEPPEEPIAHAERPAAKEVSSSPASTPTPDKPAQPSSEVIPAKHAAPAAAPPSETPSAKAPGAELPPLELPPEPPPIDPAATLDPAARLAPLEVPRIEFGVPGVSDRSVRTPGDVSRSGR